jgi:hypothetical protein
MILQVLQEVADFVAKYISLISNPSRGSHNEICDRQINKLIKKGVPPSLVNNNTYGSPQKLHANITLRNLLHVIKQASPPRG